MSRLTLAACWALLLLGTSAIYSAGLHGIVVFDDEPNIFGNESLQIHDLTLPSLRRAAASGIASQFKRPISMVSFGVNCALTGLDPFYFKLTNLAIHLVNTLLAGALVWLLVRNYSAFAPVRESAGGIALATAAIWSLHPLQVSTTLYVVQRMVLLSSLFTLIGLILYCVGRQRQHAGRSGSGLILGALLLCTPLAFLSKETGVLLFAYVIVIELFATMPRAAGSRAEIPARLLLWICAAGAAAALAFLAIQLPRDAAGFHAKGFTVGERLLSEPRALLFYLRMLLVPNLSQMGLVHDDWPASRSLLLPPSTLPALALIVAAIASLPWLRRKWPGVAFCVAWFLAGHSMEAGPLPLDLVYEHRNYLPSLGLFVGLTVAGNLGLSRFAARAWLKPVAAVLVVSALAALTSLRVYEWKNPLHWGIVQAAHHPQSPVAQMELGAAYTTLARGLEQPSEREANFKKADAALAEAYRLDPRLANGPVARLQLRFWTGRPIPQGLYDELISTISRGPLATNTRISLVSLLSCAAHDPRCEISADQFMAVINAALNNPECGTYFASQVLALAAEFYGEKEHNIPMAITLAKGGTELPDSAPEAGLPLVRWLIVGGYLNQAEQALDELDRTDRLGLLDERRALLRAGLSEARKRGTQPPGPDSNR